MFSVRLLLLIALCGGLGAVSRYLLSVWSARWFGDGFPHGTLLVNLLGCLLLGMLAQLALSSQLISPQWRVALSAGFLGGLTTFSTFALETYRHLERGQWPLALGSVAAHLLLGLVAVFVGIQLVRAAA